MKEVLIYGTNEFATQLYLHLSYNELHHVVGFVESKEYKNKQEYLSLPVYDLNELEHFFSRDEVRIIIGVGYKKLNAIREIVYNEIKASGFKLFTYISPRAFISKNVMVGDGCFIGDNVVIGPGSKIGNGVIIYSGVCIGEFNIISDFCFLSIGVISGGYTQIGKRSFIGLHSTIKNNITLAEDSFIGSATNLLYDTESYGVYVGNPGKMLKKYSEDIII